MTNYTIDGTKDFYLQFNANIPNTSVGFHGLGLRNADNTKNIGFATNWQSTYRDKIWCEVGGSLYSGETNGRKDFFIKKEGNTLSMGWDNTTKYTTTYSFEDTYYLQEQVYRDTLYIYTAKLTYL